MHFFYDEKKIIWVDIIALQTMVLLCRDFTIMFEQNAGITFIISRLLRSQKIFLKEKVVFSDILLYFLKND